MFYCGDTGNHAAHLGASRMLLIHHKCCNDYMSIMGNALLFILLTAETTKYVKLNKQHDRFTNTIIPLCYVKVSLISCSYSAVRKVSMMGWGLWGEGEGRDGGGE